jgi:hypothetical protein
LRRAHWLIIINILSRDQQLRGFYKNEGKISYYNSGI